MYHVRRESHVTVKYLIFRSCLHDLLLHHVEYQAENGPKKTEQWYFLEAIRFKRIKELHAIALPLPQSYWTELFRGRFENLIKLNVYLSCNDQLLALIPDYCPNLEYLDASSPMSGRFETSDSDRIVTDSGLRYLARCRKLKVLKLNYPRPCMIPGAPRFPTYVTFSGLRHLLKSVPTLEAFPPVDIGEVLSTGFEDVDSLNLRIVEHWSPSSKSLEDIFRLCKLINRLILIGPVDDSKASVTETLCQADISPSEIELHDIKLGDQFDAFLNQFGLNLTSLTLTQMDRADEITFKQVILIAKHCPNLRVFGCNQLVNRVSDPLPPTNLRQFAKLEILSLSGWNLNFKKLLTFCTEFAQGLEELRLDDERSLWVRVDRQILDFIKSTNLKRLFFSRNFRCSDEIALEIIEKFPNLRQLTAYGSDFVALKKELASQNYDIEIRNVGSFSRIFHNM